MINVTRPWLPDRKRLDAYLDQIYRRCHLTNNGPLERQLTERLQEYLGVRHLILVSNGTLALQVAYRALGLTGEVITTPFSFVATSSSLVWQGLQPVFVDIDPETFNLDPSGIEAKITSETSAIVPTHIFGNPCDVEGIQQIARRHKLKVIYDAAHTFGSQYKGKSLLAQGDISTISFHATKLFHTLEGGAIATDDDQLAEKIRLMINFGIRRQSQIELCGINAKMNEVSAAMGLCVLDDMALIQEQRAQIWQRYLRNLDGVVNFQQWLNPCENNHAHAPIVLASEAEVVAVKTALNECGIAPRRYFHPSLDTLAFLGNQVPCRHSRELADRILCLPIFPGLEMRQIDKICAIISNIILKQSLQNERVYLNVGVSFKSNMLANLF